MMMQGTAILGEINFDALNDAVKGGLTATQQGLATAAQIKAAFSRPKAAPTVVQRVAAAPAPIAAAPAKTNYTPWIIGGGIGLLALFALGKKR